MGVKLGFLPRDRTHIDQVLGTVCREYEREVMKGTGENCIMRNFTPSTGMITKDEMDRACSTDE